MSREKLADADRSVLVAREVAQFCAILPGVLALVALIGWASDQLVLAQFGPGNIPMAPATALAFLLYGTGLLVRSRWSDAPGGCRLGGAAGALVVGMTCLLMVGMVAGFNFQLEHLLVRSTDTLDGLPIGHMSPITALGLLLMGLGLLVLSPPSARMKPRPGLGGALGLAVTLAGLVFLQGYAYRMPLLYGGTIIPVALPTAILLLCSGVGLLATAGPQVWPLRIMTGPSVRARLSRVLLPTMLALTIGGHWLAIVLLNHGVNPVFGMAIASLLTMAAVGGAIVLIARGIGGSIDRAKQALRSSEAILRQTQEVSKVGGWECDVTSRQMAWTEEMLRILELPPDYRPGAVDREIGFLRGRGSPPDHRGR